MKVVRVIPKPSNETYDIRGLTYSEYQQLMSALGSTLYNDDNAKLYQKLKFIQTEQAT